MNRHRPYSVVRRTDEDLVWYELAGPVDQPCDLTNEADPDLFCEMMNDAYEKGFRAGLVASVDMPPDELFEAARRAR